MQKSLSWHLALKSFFVKIFFIFLKLFHKLIWKFYLEFLGQKMKNLSTFYCILSLKFLEKTGNSKINFMCTSSKREISNLSHTAKKGYRPLNFCQKKAPNSKTFLMILRKDWPIFPKLFLNSKINYHFRSYNKKVTGSSKKSYHAEGRGP